MECTGTRLTLSEGKILLTKTQVAGVDCTQIHCSMNSDKDDIIDYCSSQGSVRLMNNGIESTCQGGVEYCNGYYWTPLCTIDNRVSSVICRQLGHIQCNIMLIISMNL